MNFFSNIISGVTNFFTPQAPSAPPVSSFSNPVVTESVTRVRDFVAPMLERNSTAAYAPTGVSANVVHAARQPRDGATAGASGNAALAEMLHDSSYFMSELYQGAANSTDRLINNFFWGVPDALGVTKTWSHESEAMPFEAPAAAAARKSLLVAGALVARGNPLPILAADSIVGERVADLEAARALSHLADLDGNYEALPSYQKQVVQRAISEGSRPSKKNVLLDTARDTMLANLPKYGVWLAGADDALEAALVGYKEDALSRITGVSDNKMNWLEAASGTETHWAGGRRGELSLAALSSVFGRSSEAVFAALPGRLLAHRYPWLVPAVDYGGAAAGGLYQNYTTEFVGTPEQWSIMRDRYER